MNYVKSFVAAVMLLGLAARLLAQESLILPEQLFPQLDETLQRAIKQSPRMLLRNLDLAAAAGDLRVAKSGLYPTLGGYYQFTTTRDRRQDQPGKIIGAEKQGYDLRLTQPIFQWGDRINTAKIGELRKKISDENYIEAYRQLAQEIRTVYLRLIISKASLIQARYDRDLAEAQIRVAADKLAKKVMSPGEYAQMEITTDQERLDADSAEADFEQAVALYSTLTGEKRLSLENIPDDIPAMTESQKLTLQNSLGEFLSRKDTDTRSLAVLRKSSEIDNLTYRMTTKRLYPKVNFIAGLSLDQQSYTIIGSKYNLESQYIGIYVNWTIFDGLATRGAIASSLARKRQSEQIYKDAADKIGENAQNAAKNVTLTYRQAEINNRIFESKRNFLRLQKDGFLRGEISDTEVSKAQSGYNAAWVVALAARSTYLMRVGEYLAITSQDPILNKISVNGSK